MHRVYYTSIGYFWFKRQGGRLFGVFIFFILRITHLGSSVLLRKSTKPIWVLLILNFWTFLELSTFCVHILLLPKSIKKILIFPIKLRFFLILQLKILKTLTYFCFHPLHYSYIFFLFSCYDGVWFSHVSTFTLHRILL